MNIEIWKVITNFSNYEISNYGNIKNKYNQQILNPQLVSSYFTIKQCVTIILNKRKYMDVENHIKLLKKEKNTRLLFVTIFREYDYTFY